MTLATLVLRSLSRAGGVLAGVAGLLVLFNAAIVLQAASIEEAGTFAMLGRMTPEFIQRWIGESLGALGSFAGIVGFSYCHPIIVLMISMVSALVASELVADVEAGRVDLLLARPISRHWMVSRSALMLIVCPAALGLVMVAATTVAVQLWGPAGAEKPSIGMLSLLALNLVAVAWTIGAVAIALSSVVRRRGAALAPAAILAVGFFFVNVLAASWTPAQTLDVFSPFHYYQGPRILAGAFSPARDVLILVTASAALIAVAYWRFAQRDV
jgi:ABC-2 type transport system permease protein